MTRRTPLNVEFLESRALLSAVSARMTTDRSVYSVGQPVQLTFTETNDTNKPIVVDEGPSIDGFVIEQNNTVVWRSNAGINPMFIAVRQIQPGQSLTLTATWNGVPNVGTSTTAVATGTFVVVNQSNPQAKETFQITKTSSSPTSTTSPSPTPPSAPISSTPPSTTPVSPPSPTPLVVTPVASSSAPPSTTPVSPSSPAPIVATSVASSVTSKHHHAVHDNAHHGVAKVTHITQSLPREHHQQPGTK